MNSRKTKIFSFVPSTGNFNTDLISIASSYSTNGSILAYRSNIFDMILLMLTCKVHKKVLLRLTNNDHYFTPFFPLIINESWQASINYYLECLLKQIDAQLIKSIKSNLLQLLQIKIPKYSDYLYQIFIHTEISNCTGQCNNNFKDYKWFKMEQIGSSYTDLFGPDPQSYFNKTTFARCAEFSVQSEIKQQSKKWNLIQTMEYNEEDVANLFDDFVQHCFPSQYMNQQLFNSYLNQTGISIGVNSSLTEPTRLFNSFCIANSYYISFKDFLLTFVALDKKCPHGAFGGELRTRCIFRYYTKIGSQVITHPEVVQIYQDIIKTNKRKIADNAVAAADALFKNQNLNKEQNIQMDKFIDLVGSLVIRGTASIFRCNTSPLAEFRLKKAYSQMMMRDVEIEKIISKKPFPSRTKKLCKNCSRQNYSLSIHSIVVDNKTNKVFHEQELASDLIPKISKINRDSSVEIINTNNIYNEIRLILRRFSKSKYGFPYIDPDSDKGPRWDKQDDRIQLAEKVLKICNDAKELFKKMPRVLKVQSPIYVFGDIHGNFKDLMIYDHLFWKMVPNGFISNSLFLGDYVDRGDNSIECILYLFCLKLLIPSKFNLLRGNHESRAIQQQFTFYKECLEKFGAAGNTVWETFNLAFDNMPLCAVINEKIYCAHGGIPTNASRMEYLYDIPSPLSNPNTQCKVAWEILWNDPVSRNEYKEFADLFRNDSFPDYPRGFLPNIKRGTAFYYSEDAIDNFLEQNDLQFVIRAHEVIPPGFQFHMDGKMMTIFSCSNYCGAVNESAVVFIENCKLRIIKIETNEKI